jgi:hypothetical protein
MSSRYQVLALFVLLFVKAVSYIVTEAKDLMLGAKS